MTSVHPPSDCLFSAVILSFNCNKYIADCVEHLIAAFDTFGGQSEVLIFENGSIDGSADAVRTLAQRHPEVVQAHFSERNCGTTISRNSLLSRARGRYVLIIDADATIDAAALATLRKTLEADPEIGIVVPQLRYPDNRFQISVDDFPTITRKLRRFIGLKSMEQSAVPPAVQTEVDYAISACWLLPRALLSSVGLFDERIFYSPEDVDYCARTWLAGYRIVYRPDATAIHDAQELSRGQKIGRFTLSHAKGLVYYFIKHRYCWRRNTLVRRIASRRLRLSSVERD